MRELTNYPTPGTQSCRGAPYSQANHRPVEGTPPTPQRTPEDAPPSPQPAPGDTDTPPTMVGCHPYNTPTDVITDDTSEEVCRTKQMKLSGMKLLPTGLNKRIP